MITTEEKNARQAAEMLNTAISYARIILRKYGELGPFGFSMSQDGQVARETLEIPRLPSDAARLWKLLGDHMKERARRGAVQSVAMAANVSLAAPSAEGYADAVLVKIEHENGYAVEVTVPYRIYGGQLHNLFPRRVATGKAVMEEAASQVFQAR